VWFTYWYCICTVSIRLDYTYFQNISSCRSRIRHDFSALLSPSSTETTVLSMRPFCARPFSKLRLTSSHSRKGHAQKGLLQVVLRACRGVVKWMKIKQRRIHYSVPCTGGVVSVLVFIPGTYIPGRYRRRSLLKSYTTWLLRASFLAAGKKLPPRERGGIRKRRDAKDERRCWECWMLNARCEMRDAMSEKSNILLHLLHPISHQ
jgi:hypothetical protein